MIFLRFSVLRPIEIFGGRLTSLGIHSHFRWLITHFRDEVERAVQKVVGSAFRESSVAVVDCCRDAATVIASRWLWQETGDESFLRKELAPLSETLAIERKKFVAANAARTISILHSRGKSNEQVAKGVDPPSEDDAEFAVRAIALILRELGWAASWS